MVGPVLGEASALVVSVTLGVAAVSKVRDVRTFREQIADFERLPYSTTGVAAITVIGWEASAAVLLIAPPTQRVGAIVSLPLFVIFVGVLVATIRGGRAIPCACFGGGGELDTVDLHSLTRTSLLLICAVEAAVATSSDVDVSAVAIAVLLGVAIFLITEVIRLVTEIGTSGRALVEANEAASALPREVDG